MHTHSTYATAWAQAGCDIPNIGTTHADYFSDDSPCTRDMSEAEVNGAYEKETGTVAMMIIQKFSYSVTQLLSYSVIPVYSDFSFCRNRFRTNAEIRTSTVIVKFDFCLTILVGSYIRNPE